MNNNSKARTDAQVYIVILLDIITILNKCELSREEYDMRLRETTKLRLGEEISVAQLEVLIK